MRTITAFLADGREMTFTEAELIELIARAKRLEPKQAA